MKRINSFDVAHEQYQRLTEKSKTTTDAQEKGLILRRRINLLSVMEFLNSETRTVNNLRTPRKI